MQECTSLSLGIIAASSTDDIWFYFLLKAKRIPFCILEDSHDIILEGRVFKSYVDYVNHPSSPHTTLVCQQLAFFPTTVPISFNILALQAAPNCVLQCAALFPLVHPYLHWVPASCFPQLDASRRALQLPVCLRYDSLLRLPIEIIYF